MIEVANVREHLIDRLTPIFGSPKNADGLARELVAYVPDDALAGDLDVLATRMIETRKAKGFPSASEMIVAVRSISASARHTGPAARYGVAAEEAKGGAERQAWLAMRSRLVGTELARRAVDGRWAPGLVAFVMKNDRLPDEQEQRRMISESRTNDALARENASVLDGGLVRLREGMHWRAAADVGIDLPMPAELGFKPRRGTRFASRFVAPGRTDEPPTYSAEDLAPTQALLDTIADAPERRQA